MVARRVEIPVGRRTATAKSPFVSSQDLVNCFLERDPEPGIPDSIYGGPGLTQFGSAGSGPIRGMHMFGGALCVVSGETLYTMTSDGVPTSRGTISGSDPTVIDDNGIHTAIVSDNKTYLWNNSSLEQITDEDFRVASSVAFLRQVLIFSARNSGVFFTSELADAVNYDGLDVATAETKPDKIVRITVNNDEAFMFGELGAEGWYFSGAATGIPLSPTQTSLEYGLIGRDAICSIDNSLAWIDHEQTVRMLRGNSPVVISDPSIASIIQSWPKPEVTRAFSFSIRGHEWMALRNPKGCLLWDATTGLWHRRQSHGLDTWRVGCSVRAFGKVLVGDAINGTIWQVDPDAHAEGSEPLVRELVSHTLGPSGQPFTLERLEVEVETGVGLASGQGSDPQIWAQFSRDGGRTYGTRMLRSLGASGNRNLRVVWNGPFGDFPPHGGVIKLGVSDPVRLVVTKAHAEITANAT